MLEFKRVIETDKIQMALSLFNDLIVSEAIRMSIPLLDLRQIFVELGDYANPIEPSTQGGKKMASAIAQIILDDSAIQKVTRIYGRP